MKYKSNTYTTSDVKVFALQVFDYLNGKINKKVLARNIKFIKDRDIELGFGDEGQAIFTASVFTNTLVFDPNSIIDIDRVVYNDKGRSMTYEEFTGEIIQVVAHELSHLDQDIDQRLFISDQSYNDMIEITNELHTLKWIKSHYKKLQKIFDVKFDYKFAFGLSAYLIKNDTAALGYKDTDYMKVPDIHTKLFNDMNLLLETNDILGLFQEALERGYKGIGICRIKMKKDYSLHSWDLLDLGTIEVLLTEPTRANTIWNLFNELLLSNYKSYWVAVSDRIIYFDDDKHDQCKDDIIITIIERPEVLKYSPNFPLKWGSIKIKRKGFEWADKYFQNANFNITFNINDNGSVQND